MSTYAWTITKDHLTDPADPDDVDAVGVCGPGEASDEALAQVRTGHGRLFRMYDDDGILYYTGRLFDTSGDYDEDACYAPLGNYGMPAAGAVEIRYHGHPEMDCSLTQRPGALYSDSTTKRRKDEDHELGRTRQRPTG